jgi:hypothetical protein
MLFTAPPAESRNITYLETKDSWSVLEMKYGRLRHGPGDGFNLVKCLSKPRKVSHSKGRKMNRTASLRGALTFGSATMTRKNSTTGLPMMPGPKKYVQNQLKPFVFQNSFAVAPQRKSALKEFRTTM